MTATELPGQASSAPMHEILFVVVLYRLAPDASPAIQSLPAFCRGLQQPAVVIWNNGSENTPAPSGPLKVFLHYDPHNSGVTAAYQFAIGIGKENGYKWLMLLDEDTTLPEGGIHLYAPFMQKATLIAPLVYDQKGLLSPFRFNGVRGYRLKVNPLPLLELKRYRVINSGLLLQIATVESVGGFPTNFPLDFSDIVLQERLLTKTSCIAVAPIVIQQHFSGNTKPAYPDALQRFGTYVSAGMLYAAETRRRLKMMFFLALRATHLSLAYRSKGFLSALIQRNHSSA